MRHVRWPALAALTLALTLTMATPSGAHAEVVASHVEEAGTATAVAPRVATAAAASVVYPRAGEGLISLTARTCGTAATWRQQATANRVYGPAFVIYFGRAYTVSCTRAATTATRSTATRTVTSSGWVHPLPGAYCISGYRTNSRPGHNGIDLPRPSGTPIRAVHSGRVTRVTWQSGAGWYVVLDHGTVNTVYMHMRSRSFLGYGQAVRAGQTIGYIGATGNATGPHLHFEVQLDPMWNWSSWRNPSTFMRARGVRVGCL